MSDRSETLRRWFPTPFVAIVVLLVVLIVLTPNLLSSASPSAGSLPTEAELIVDHASGDTVTHLYVRGIGLVRYTSIAVVVVGNFSWTSPPSSSNLSFGKPTKWTDVLAASTATASNPFAVNVTAVYVDASGTTVDFVGTFAFDLAGGVLSEIVYVPSTGGVTTTPENQLPLAIVLETVAPGGSS
ncbi:MAG: hypothetical protein L3K16_07045 [Thermoplasmata archaeon]|nr:hypothetical protein [Thermoplasmata archaeon]